MFAANTVIRGDLLTHFRHRLEKRVVQVLARSLSLFLSHTPCSLTLSHKYSTTTTTTRLVRRRLFARRFTALNSMHLCMCACVCVYVCNRCCQLFALVLVRTVVVVFVLVMITLKLASTLLAPSPVAPLLYHLFFNRIS